MSRTLEWQLAGADVVLHGERALFYPAESALLVADTHFGKAALMRRRGLAVPTGQSRDDLQRLSSLLDEFKPHRLIVLGDFFHHRPLSGEPFLDLFPDWRARHQAVSMEAVVGNHDRHAVGVDLGIDWHEHLDLGPFRLRHEPEPVTGRHVLAGHIHPVLTLQVAADRLRAPVFWFREQVSVLPSFGALTGGWDLPRKSPGQTVLVVEGELFEGPD
ncbi:ligase-associated DNA damage response endonuclease PdeM [uncultured Halopseudomonas sp.]|uniref:ligase-associated DNA damage response endonuclease PdeM n=1 Tax=uncultured Halopseudomonas sp. TaxID=2901193 RepID=UPI0030ED533E|tara:strand:- start:30791 stop:31438 length:648 start_codon:yes stop_codon:yes gene_type:complete